MNQQEAAKIMMNIGCLHDIAEATRNISEKIHLGAVCENLQDLIKEYLPVTPLPPLQQP